MCGGNGTVWRDEEECLIFFAWKYKSSRNAWVWVCLFFLSLPSLLAGSKRGKGVSCGDGTNAIGK